MGLAVIAPFTEEELRSMWAYDRRCSDQGDYRMDLDPTYQKLYNMTKTGTIRYRVDIAQQVKKMGLNLRKLSLLCGLNAAEISRQTRSAYVTATHAWTVLRVAGKPFEYFFQWEKG